MLREINLGHKKLYRLIAIVVMMFSLTYSPDSYGKEQIIEEESTQEINSNNIIEIEILPALTQERTQADFIYAKSEITQYETESVKKEDILRTIPSINTEDNKMLGLVIPPFAYFKTKF